MTTLANASDRATRHGDGEATDCDLPVPASVGAPETAGCEAGEAVPDIDS